MSATPTSGAAERVMYAMRGVLHDASVGGVARAAMTIAIQSAHESLHPLELAQRCNRSARSLRRDLRVSGLPPPSALLTWGKVLVAVALLDDHAVTVEHAAHEVGLPDSAALSHLCRRLIGTTPGEARQRGGVKYAIGMLESRIAPTRTGDLR